MVPTRKTANAVVVLAALRGSKNVEMTATTGSSTHGLRASRIAKVRCAIIE